MPAHNPMMSGPISDATKTSAGGGLLDMAKTPPAASPVAPVQAATADVAPQTQPRGLFGMSLPAGLSNGIGQLQDKLGDASTNPLFQVGMSFLGSGYDGSNPYTAIQKSLGGIQPQQIAGAKADQEAADKAKEAQLEQLLMQLGLKFGSGAGGSTVPPASRQAAGAATLIR
jgi:hypothetical protein